MPAFLHHEAAKNTMATKFFFSVKPGTGFVCFVFIVPS